MRAFRRTLALAALATAVVTLGACATTRVNASLERGMNFTQYKSYAWAADEKFSTGDPRLDASLAGYIRIVTGYGREAVYRIA